MSKTIEERLFRAPYLHPRPGSDQPLTVLCSLLSRADNTPLHERRRANNHLLTAAGRVIADPAADAAANAFESNSNLNFEHWGEYWRKVHGVRFIHAEEPDDRSLERLLRYDQLHRFTPGPTHTDAPPYRAPVDEQGKLWPTVIGHIEAYRRPRWDGIAYLNFAGPEDIAVVLGNARVREKILPEDQAIFRDIAPVLSRQYIILPSATGNEAVTLVKLHARDQGTCREAFQQWWLHEHAPLVAEQAGGWARRYVQLHNIGPTEPGHPLYHPQASGIDGVTLLGFASLNDLEDFLRSPGQKAIARDEARMADPSAEQWWTTVGMVLVNRIAPECATARTGSGTT
ncbi:EthD domain-containing protein [Pseudomonas typographi]|uniref:EthD domain-containing protein n=1 Tax=Pseudomonas typographi TaxID=2715964 RepID=UPI001687AB81|nr:EthD domain-containing protein [Pseudomonas typographi]MBD1552476.1 EthD domain-containing protein [Pseudomonas typographi]